MQSILSFATVSCKAICSMHYYVIFFLSCDIHFVYLEWSFHIIIYLHMYTGIVCIYIYMCVYVDIPRCVYLFGVCVCMCDWKPDLWLYKISNPELSGRFSKRAWLLYHFTFYLHTSLACRAQNCLFQSYYAFLSLYLTLIFFLLSSSS